MMALRARRARVERRLGRCHRGRWREVHHVLVGGGWHGRRLGHQNHRCRRRWQPRAQLAHEVAPEAGLDLERALPSLGFEGRGSRRGLHRVPPPPQLPLREPVAEHQPEHLPRACTLPRLRRTAGGARSCCQLSAGRWKSAGRRGNLVAPMIRCACDCPGTATQ
jgi:hypothetical protein